MRNPEKIWNTRKKYAQICANTCSTYFPPPWPNPNRHPQKPRAAGEEAQTTTAEARPGWETSNIMGLMWEGVYILVLVRKICWELSLNFWVIPDIAGLFLRELYAPKNQFLTNFYEKKICSMTGLLIFWKKFNFNKKGVFFFILNQINRWK